MLENDLFQEGGLDVFLEGGIAFLETDALTETVPSLLEEFEVLAAEVAVEDAEEGHEEADEEQDDECCDTNHIYIIAYEGGWATVGLRLRGRFKVALRICVGTIDKRVLMR